MIASQLILFLLSITAECPVDEFLCVTSKRCIPAVELCNGIENCGDGSDEINCSKSVCGQLTGCLLYCTIHS